MLTWSEDIVFAKIQDGQQKYSKLDADFESVEKCVKDSMQDRWKNDEIFFKIFINMFCVQMFPFGS